MQSLELTLQFSGELAEDSLDVPSYIAALISGVIMYARLSELSYCPADMTKMQNRIDGVWCLWPSLIAAQSKLLLRKMADTLF
jgi:hypothetical protein